MQYVVITSWNRALNAKLVNLAKHVNLHGGDAIMFSIFIVLLVG